MAQIYVDKKRLSQGNQTKKKISPILIIKDGVKSYANQVTIKSGLIKYENKCGSCGTVYIESNDYEIID